MPFVPPKDPAVVEKWDSMPRDATVLKVNGHLISDFEPLLKFSKLRNLSASCKSSSQYSIIGRLTEIEKLSLTFVRNNVLPDLKLLSGLKSLVLDRFEGKTLDGIGAFTSLQELRLLDCNKLCDLSAIADASNLESLYISTPTSWVSSRKVLSVPSFMPLAKLKALRSLIMRGVQPKEDGLQPLNSLSRLEVLEISHVYSFELKDYAALAAFLPDARGNCLRPYFKMNFQSPCRKCGAEEVWLTAPRKGTKRSLCPTCCAEKLKMHVEEFESIRARATRLSIPHSLA